MIGSPLTGRGVVYTVSTMSRAKLFQNGRSQAVRLPKEFRFEGDEVSVRREGDAVILEPIKKREWPEGFFDSIRFHEAEGEGFELPDDPAPRDIAPLVAD